MEYEKILEYPPFSVVKEEKREILTKRLQYLNQFHDEHCEEYHKIRDLFLEIPKRYEEFPFLPIRLFKEFQLKSISENTLTKEMTSSGTTGQSVSKIYLDKNTARNQQKTLIQIMSDFIPESRMPMLILDSERVIRDPSFFSARKAGILGFSLFGKQRLFALDDAMKLRKEEIKAFLETYSERTILLFGHTSVIWEFFYEALAEKEIDLSNAILIHGGGWKKLASRNISDAVFKASLQQKMGLSQVHNFYGMAEQTGSIYLSCEYGHMHASTYSEILIRRAEDFSLCEKGEKGMIQLISLLPESYPGHNILTEDEGVLLGEDDCPCGRKGKYFHILGRIEEAEIRGCSDTYGL